MSLPYIPLYIDDYEADTAHLTILEDGAYNRLLRLLWRSPGCVIPDDDAWIFRRMRAHTDEEKAAVITVIGEFFERKAGRITSPRLLREFKKADETSRKRSDAGKRGGRPKVTEKKEKEEKPGFPDEKPGTDTRARSSEPEPEPYKEEGGGGSACVREASTEQAESPSIRERLLAAMGLGPDGIAGPSKFLGSQADVAEAARWLALPGVTLDAACAEIAAISASKSDGPPSSFRYFTPAIQRLSAALSADPLQPGTGPRPRASPPRRLWNLDPNQFNPDGSLRQ